MAAISSSAIEVSPIAAPAIVRPIANISPLGSVDHGNSPRSRRAGRPVSSTSPWTQIVRGESDVAVAAPSSPIAVAMSSASSSSSSLVTEEENSENASGYVTGNVNKKPAWNKPPNESSTTELVGVMGGECWPALSESARVPTKSIPDSFKNLTDSTSPVLSPQVMETIPSYSQNMKQAFINGNPVLNSNNTAPSRQRSFKRNGSNPTSNGATIQAAASHNLGGEAYINSATLRDNAQRSSQTRGNNDHQQQRNSYRNRGNGRGDGSQQNSFGGRRDNDRVNQEWNSRSFNGRDPNMYPQRSMPRFIRQPPPPPPPPVPTSAPYIMPAPGNRPFVAPLGYHDYHMYYFPPPMDTFRGMPFYPGPMSQVFVPSADLQIHSKIVNQIDYYFSNENLVKDTYLRQNMDDQGWVPIKLIAGFKKMLQLTDNVQLLLDAVRSSAVVELQGDKVRRRADWMKWVMPPTLRMNNASAAAASSSNHEAAAESIQKLSLEHHEEDHVTSGHLAYYSKQPNSGETVPGKNSG